MDYYLMLNDKQCGPYSIGQIRSMWNSGAITRDILFRSTEGPKEWKKLGEILDDIEQPANALSRFLHSIFDHSTKPIMAIKVAYAFLTVATLLSLTIIFLQLSFVFWAINAILLCLIFRNKYPNSKSAAIRLLIWNLAFVCLVFFLILRFYMNFRL